jgi:protein TonB
MTTTGVGRSDAQIEEFGRLAVALVLSASAHLLLVQLLPQWVRPYEGAPTAATFTLTVSLAPMPRARPKAPVPVQPPPKYEKPIDGAARGDQPPLSMLEPEVPRDIPPDTLPDEDRPALPFLDYYYSSREVDEPAKAVGDALLVYPHEALQLRVPGEVKLRLFIDEFGALVRSEVVSADPPGVFEEAALQAVKGMRFFPARKEGQTVRSQRTVQITFDPDPPSLRHAQSTIKR